MNEIATLTLSLCAFLFSICALYLSRKWSIQGWQRAVRLPYYNKLNKFLDELNNLYFSGKLAVYTGAPDFKEYINEANTLGLNEVGLSLLEIEKLVTKADDEHRNDNSKKSAELMDEFRQEMATLRGNVQYDITRLTRNR